MNLDKTQNSASYVGPYTILDEKPLIQQLKINVSGLGAVNSFQILQLLGFKRSDSRTITLKDLSESQKKLLQDILVEGFIRTPDFYANVKDRNVSKEFEPQIFYPSDSGVVIFGDAFKSQMSIAKQRLIKLKCNVGNRLKCGRKVHGQRTKSTGRKTKIMKGFQKRKLIKKEKIAK